MNPFAFKRHLFMATACGMMPIGYLTRCGFPVLYGLMWRIVHVDTSHQPRRSDEEGIPVI